MILIKLSALQGKRRLAQGQGPRGRDPARCSQGKGHGGGLPVGPPVTPEMGSVSPLQESRFPLW